ncbi:MAG: radical SAM protein, partial [Pseudomonadota bacterium]
MAKRRPFKNLPYILNFDTRCNQRCLFCMKREDIAGKRPVTFKTITEEIEKAKGEGYTTLDFYGGEPLVYPFITQALVMAHFLGFSCYLATNATKLASQKFADDFFSKVRLKEIRTSLHSHRGDLHDAITQRKGSFKKTMRGIFRILQRKNIRLTVNTVITSLNYRHLGAIVDFLSGAGVKNISFSGLIASGGALRHPELAIGFKHL